MRLGPTERNVVSLVLVLGLLVAVNFIPPDTSLAQVREAGVLRACVPSEFPPLVTTDDERPGIDVELVGEIANELGVRRLLNTNSAIGRDFNPRNWRVTRAQCSVLAGGVVASDTTRSFLETSPSYLETGWAIVVVGELESIESAAIGFFGGISGLDRIALSRYLRREKASVSTVNSRTALIEGIDAGRFDAGVTEALTAQQVAEQVGGTAYWLPPDLRRYELTLGLWKGDLTLKRAIVSAMQRIEDDGRLQAILEEYAVERSMTTCPFCGRGP